MTPKKLPPKGSHARDIYEFLAEGGELTQVSYYERWKRFDLAQRIYDLEKKYGIPVHRDIVKKGRVKYAVYRLAR